MPDRVLELALEALEARRTVIESEIVHVRRQLGSRGAAADRGGRPVAAARDGRPKRRRRSAASRKAQSLKMKAYWAKRRAETKKAKR